MEKNAKMQQEHMVKIEEQNREFIRLIKLKRNPDEEMFDSFDDLVLKKVSKKMASISSEISITGSHAGEFGHRLTDL